MRPNIRALCASAVIGALYAVLTLALSPISYGPVQLRLSECLCLLPFFFPGSVWGLFLGCALANIMTGNIFDVVFGSLATLLAGLVTAWAGRLRLCFGSRLLGCTAPVVINALMVGAVICGAYNGLHPLAHPEVFALYALQIAAGEALVMYLIALPLSYYLPGKRFFQEFIREVNK